MSNSYDYVVVGGGVAAGYFASSLSAHLEKNGKTLLIISSDADGLAPYERPEVSKGCLNPENAAARDPKVDSDKFPWCCKSTNGTALTPEWYQNHTKITLMTGTTVTSNDTAAHTVSISTQKDPITYTKLIIASGARARVLPTFPSAVSESIGFGSVHTLRDTVDAAKLVKAMERIEDDDQPTCYDPVVVVGGGFIAMEAAASISEFSQDLHVTVVMDGGWFLPDLMTREMSKYYERQLMHRYGVRFARNLQVSGVWETTEGGSFCSVDGAAMSLAKTKPLMFTAAPRQFTDCRGVKLRGKESDEDADELRLPARFVVLGVGTIPNSDAFEGVDKESNGSIVVDGYCRTSAEDVFAIGDVTQAGGHVDSARKMADIAAKVLTEEEGDGFDGNIPYVYSRILDLGWKFYGRAAGEVVTIGLEELGEEKADPSTFAAFYVEDGVIVGVFLEKGSDEQNAKLERVIREKPRVLNFKKLAKKSIDEILDDPHLLTPPVLGMGEFHAEDDEEMIQSVWSKFEEDGEKGGRGTVRVELMGELMALLGADFDDAEVVDACTALDDRKLGVVRYNHFISWWTN